MKNITKRVIRNYKKLEDKAFYAAYLNTAKQNVFIIIRDISERLGLGFDLSNDDNILNAVLWQKLENNNNPVLGAQIVEQLKDKLPFVKNLAENYSYRTRKNSTPEPNDYGIVLKEFIQQLNAYRNFYTHAVHNRVTTSTGIIKSMQFLFTYKKKVVKERFSLEANDVKHLVRLGKDNKERPGFKYGFMNSEQEITENGFLFFVCLWLQRKDAQKFLKQHFDFNRFSSATSEKATLNTYTILNARPPKPRLKSDNSTLSLLLEMVNELKRCPKELHSLLLPTDRNKFNSTNDDGDEIELVRHNNRFYYFALRYFDTKFSNIKFHIDLGNYCFHAYNKQIEDNLHVRRWSRRMLGFGNVVDFNDQNRPDDWKNKVRKTSDKDRNSNNVYVTETTPHYHINNMNIGLKFFDNYNGTSTNIWPDLPDFDTGNKEKTKPRNTSPDCWLSLYELPAMAFYQYLYENGYAKRSAEQIIRIHYDKINKLFDDILTGKISNGLRIEKLKQILQEKEMEVKHLPKAVLHYLTTKPENKYEKNAERRLETLLNETQQLLDKLERNIRNFNRSPGNKNHVEVKCGNMGDFLARDMLLLQKPIDGHKGKANSTEFQLLQAKLAYFGKFKNELAQTFTTCQLISSANPHPFLHKINICTCKGVLDFYKIYYADP